MGGGGDVGDVLGPGPQAVLLADVDDEAAAAAWEADRAALSAHAGPDGVVLGGAAWIVTATKP